jgi:soluble lytic murein transglycosylase-like protein
VVSRYQPFSAFFQIAALISALFLAFVKPTHCYAFNGNISDSMKCLSAIRYYESKYGIPQNLLSSISLVESGRWHAEHKRVLPWPWAVNVAGEPYFFETKDQALSFIKQKLAQGIKNIDVGCNQINLYHHGDKFANIEQVINPEMNSEYAASFLKGHYTETKHWPSAVARYHSFTPHLGRMYASKVLTAWRNYGNQNIEIQPISISAIKERLQLINKQSEVTKKTRQPLRKISSSRRSSEPIIVFSRTAVQNNERIVEVSERMLKKY